MKNLSRFFSLFLVLFSSTLVSAQHENAIDCPSAWGDGLLGDCIGNRGTIKSYDLDNDGADELICMSNSYDGNFFTLSDFWFVLKYDSLLQDYQQIYVSNVNEFGYSGLSILDIDGDGSMEIAMADGFNGIVYYDSQTFIKKGSFDAQGLAFIVRKILRADADNDGEEEIVVTEGCVTLLLNKDNFNLEQEILTYEEVDLEVGNIDDDPELEIVFDNGRIIELSNTSIKEEWDFDPIDNGGLVRLSDIDNDGKKEIIHALPWNKINVFDAELQQLKYELNTNQDIAALRMIDVNGDQIEELLYADGQWGSIYAIDAQNQNQLWEIINPEYSATDITIGDFDGDGNQELTWATGCENSGSDYLYIFDLASRTQEWQSKDIRGPYFAIEVGDVDNDGDLEIVTVSQSSEAFSGSGIITVYDAETKIREWQSSSDLLGSFTTNAFYNVEIADFQMNGDNDLIFAMGKDGDGRFLVLDGESHQIELDTTFSGMDINTFYFFEVANIDQSGSEEFIVADQDELFIFNGLDFSIIQREVIPSANLPGMLAVEDLDKDGNLEIILCNNQLHVYDQELNNIWRSPESNYISFAIADIDAADDQLEIIALQDALVQIFNAEDFSMNGYLYPDLGPYTGVVAANYLGDEKAEVVVAGGGRLTFIVSDDRTLLTQSYGYELGLFDAFTAVDFDEDGFDNILVGTNNKVFEPSMACFGCLSFEASADWTYSSCTFGDYGSITVSLQGGTPPFTYNWSNGGSGPTQNNLQPGFYTVEITDATNCKRYAEAEIAGEYLAIAANQENVGCEGIDDGYLDLIIVQGAFPITVEWNTGATELSLFDLGIGTYSVTITDANNCTFIDTFDLVEQTFTSSFEIIKACNGEAIGAVFPYNMDPYIPPFTYQWSNGSNQEWLDQLPPGEISVTITNGRACQFIDTLQIENGILSTEVESLTPSCSQSWTGSAVTRILDGLGPFYINYWNGWTADSIGYDLPPGENYVFIESADGCMITDTFFIEENILTVEHTSIDVSCWGANDGAITVHINSDNPPFQVFWDNGSTDTSLVDLPPGFYGGFINDLFCTTYFGFEIFEPAPIVLDYLVVNDNNTNPFPEGWAKVFVDGGNPPFSYFWSTGDTTDTARELGEGVYFVQVTDANGCTMTGSVMIDFISGTEQPLWATGLSVHPNPSDGLVFIELPENQEEDLHLQLLDNLGRVTKQQNILKNTQQLSLDLTEYAAGMYWLRFATSDGVWTERVVLEY